ncbi:P27 family phage terminase small subunit [Kineococcus gynurae]|uniref:P27 family phage terminase small subunit n=1 Tax=Kineococcus gynurae TaxID=452979 RepID=A0ABV5LWX1_9ACTN
MPGRKPVEQKRRTGRAPGKDSAGRDLPGGGNVRALPGADGVPPCPPSLVDGGAGAARWEKLWREAKDWLAPGTDWHLLVRLCEAEDLRAGMREALAETGFFVMGSMGQQRPNPLIDKLRLHDAEILRMERECGLTPAARGALGVGEVGGDKPASPLDEILRQAASRGRKSG